MFYEFAVQPECMVDYNHFTLLRKEFSVSKGRLVSRFPDHWPKMVRDATKGLSFIHKKRVKSELERLRREGMLNVSREYDDTISWLDNVSRQYRGEPPKSFYAVIANQQPADAPPCLLLNDENDVKDYDEWNVPADKRVCRTTVDLVETAALLLKISKKILFVDKMFNPASPRWKEVLMALVEGSIDEAGEPPRFEYHVKIDREDEFDAPEQRNKEYQAFCDQNLKKILPVGVSLNIYWWSQKHKGDFFHGRYVLTDKGGIRFDWGLDKGKPGEKTDVSRMSDDTKKEYLRMFDTDTKSLDLIEHVTVRGMKE